MIQSRKDLHEYILQDMKRNGVELGGVISWMKIHANPHLWF